MHIALSTEVVTNLCTSYVHFLTNEPGAHMYNIYTYSIGIHVLYYRQYETFVRSLFLVHTSTYVRTVGKARHERIEFVGFAMLENSKKFWVKCHLHLPQYQEVV